MLTSILDAIGITPLLQLKKLSAGLPGTVLLKLENRNPGGSIKDRVAAHLLQEALKDKSLAPGGTIIEATSGNMGIGLALAARALGLKCLLTMPESMSIERRKLLAAFGAELVLTPAAEGMKGAVDRAAALAAEGKGLLIGQFSNPKTPDAHYLHTGPEIFAQTEGRVDMVVAGVGSGSTIMGCGRYLKEKKPSVRLIALEPEESCVISGGKAGPHGIQGIGAGFVPAIFDPSFMDEVLTVSTQTAIETARALLRSEGVNAGITTGANVHAALTLASREDAAGKLIVTFACDTGERYLSTALFA